jgi:hypothetical protein
VAGKRDLAAVPGGLTAQGEPKADGHPTDVERRLNHLESELEGLQDAVHRNCVRHDTQIQALLKTTQPEAVARALNDDARRRGL